jgi:hypothetical protein
MASALPKDASGIAIRQVVSKGKPAEEIAALAEKEMVRLHRDGVCPRRRDRKSDSTDKSSGAGGFFESLRPRRQQSREGQTDPRHDRLLGTFETCRAICFDLKRVFGATIYMMYVIETPKAIEFGIRQGHLTNATEKDARMGDQSAHQPDALMSSSMTPRLCESWKAVPPATESPKSQRKSALT